MQLSSEKQGTKLWRDLRAKHFTASEAPAMLGLSKYQTRDDLLKQKKFGIEKEIDSYTQTIFDKGHEYERLARPFAEEIIGKELFPVTGTEEIDGVPMLASFDGLPMNETVCWEHKTINDKLATDIPNGVVDPLYAAQMEQQCMLSGASRCLFMASDGTKENMAHCWYESDPIRQKKIIAGWKQFIKDMEEFECSDEPAQVVSEAQTTLPTVSIKVEGGISINDNLSKFGDMLTKYVKAINKKPETDQEFANLEAAVKTLKAAESALNDSERIALSQVESIDMLRKSVEIYRELARSNRLVFEKLVKSEKENRKIKLIQNSVDDLKANIETINKGLGLNYISIQQTSAAFPSAIKGKKTFTSMESSLNDELARVKIEVSELAEIIRTNLKAYDSLAKEHEFLFTDINALVAKENETFELLIKDRISTYKQNQEKLEADKQKRLDDQQAEIDKNQQAETKPEPEIVKSELVEKTAEPMDSMVDRVAMREYATALVSLPAPDVQSPEMVALLREVSVKLSDMHGYVLDNAKPEE